MTGSKFTIGLVAAFGLFFGSGSDEAQAQQTQCVSNALAGGTVDALRIPLQPCALSTNLLILTLAGANTTTQPTLQMAGYPVQNIYTSTGTAPGIGALPGAGAVVLLTSTGTSWKIVSGNASTTFSGVLTVPNGGTGLSTITTNGLIVGEGTGNVSTVAAGTTGQLLGGNTGSPPSWKTLSSVAVSSLSFGTTGLLPGSPTTGAITVTGTLVPASGGTGLTSYSVGDTLYASGTTTLAALADVATGNALISGGVATAPSWGKIGLTTHVSGLLPVGNGGSGAGTFTANGLLYGNGTSAFGAVAAGTTGQYLKGNTGSAPTWSTLASDTVTTIGFGSSGLTPSAATSGVVTVGGLLTTPYGGTGQLSYTNGQLLIGNTATGSLSKATLTAGTNVTVTNGNGTITIASTGLASGCGTTGLVTQLMTDNGAGGCASNADATFATGTLALGVNTSESGAVKLFGATSGNLTLKPAAVAGASTVLTLPGGTTDLSATGGTSQVVKQTGTGAALTVARLACADLSDAGTGCASNGGASYPSWGGIKTTAFNATAGVAYCVDTLTTGAVTMTLPASPTDGDQIRFIDCKSNFSTANLTVSRNGNTIMGLAANMTVNTNNAASTLVYVGANTDWRMY